MISYIGHPEIMIYLCFVAWPPTILLTQICKSIGACRHLVAHKSGLRLTREYPSNKHPNRTRMCEPWLQHYIDSMEAVLFSSEFSHPSEGYRKYIHVGSFVDYWLLTELTKNDDGYRLSTFMHKDRGLRLQMGPLWDMDSSLGAKEVRDMASHMNMLWMLECIIYSKAS